jgi:6-phosphogluconate dehydrogenase
MRSLKIGIVTVFAQGMELLQKASLVYKYDLNLENIAAIWREGCIIRASVLEELRTALVSQPDLSNLMLSQVFKDRLMGLQDKIRQVACMGINAGIPLPAFTASLGYYDSYRSGWLPGNLLQAQRDYFGAHTYERVDQQGIFHTQWNQKES